MNEVHITLKDVTLPASLYSPGEPRGLVIIAEGKDCKFLRRENEFLYKALTKRNIAMLFTYLLNPPESQEYDIPFDIGLMSEHLAQLTKWVFQQPGLRNVPIGYFAVNTAAASALEASIVTGDRVKAVVSYCGRPDLANPELSQIKPATLLITASENIYLTQLNWQAYELMNCEKQLVMVEGDMDGFEESGKARQIAHIVANWFDHHFPVDSARYRILWHDSRN
jgi:hypothetical protein